MRAHLNKSIIRKTSGLPADGMVQVYEHGTTTPLAQTIYVGDTGATARANPFAFANGVVDFYLDTPQRVDLVITPTGGAAQTFADVDIEAPAGPAITYGAVTAQTTFGLSASNGAATSLARSDHTHGTPATPSAAAVGALALTGGSLSGALTMSSGSPLIITGGSVLSKGDLELGRTDGTAGAAFIDFHSDGSGATDYNGRLIVPTGSSELQSTGGGGFNVTGGTLKEAGQRVYSPNNPPPVSGMTVLGGQNTTTNATANVSNAGISFVAPANGRVVVRGVAMSWSSSPTDLTVSLDNATWVTVAAITRLNGNTTMLIFPNAYGVAAFTGLTPGATYTVYYKSIGVGGLAVNYTVEG